MNRLEKIQLVIENDSKPIETRDLSLRSLNDQDLDWLISRVTQLEQCIDYLQVTLEEILKKK